MWLTSIASFFQLLPDATIKHPPPHRGRGKGHPELGLSWLLLWILGSVGMGTRGRNRWQRLSAHNLSNTHNPTVTFAASIGPQSGTAAACRRAAAQALVVTNHRKLIQLRASFSFLLVLEKKTRKFSNLHIL